MSCNCNSNSVGQNVCGNPCGLSLSNTPECESLPSQIGNFTLQFFGTVVKSEIDGQVVWSLPCDLDVGLPANPRNPEEGLACYFLRLFMDGIVGLTGPAGPAGADGTNGRNSYTVTIAGFTQPSLISPSIQISTVFNPAIYTNMVIAIQNSGWYHVDLADDSGNLWLTLINAFTGVTSGDYISAGKLVVPTGPQGASITGPQGIQGPQGPVGPMGGTFSTFNGQTAGDGAPSFEVQSGVYSQVVFGSVNPAVTLGAAGTYLITATVTISKTAAAPDSPPDSVYLELWDANAGQVLSESGVISKHLTADQWGTETICVLYTVTGDNHTIQLYAKTSGAAGHTFIEPLSGPAGKLTLINYVRLS